LEFLQREQEAMVAPTAIADIQESGQKMDNWVKMQRTSKKRDGAASRK
jgi:hypothetical protein